MIGRAILPEIGELVEKRDFSTLKEISEDWYPRDLAEAVQDLPEKERAVVFRLLQKEKTARTFEYFDLDVQTGLLRPPGREEVAVILKEMSPDDRTAFLVELPGPIVR